MGDPPTFVQIRCLDCGCQEELEHLAVDGDFDVARDLALTRAGWEVVDDNRARCPRCFTPTRYDYTHGIVFLVGFVGTIGIGWLDDRPRIVVAYMLTWSFYFCYLPAALWFRIMNAREKDPDQWKPPGPWVERVQNVTWAFGLAIGALAGLQEPQFPWWVWPFACFGGGLVAGQVLELVRFSGQLLSWLRGGRRTSSA
jgi:hypothetical protein